MSSRLTITVVLICACRAAPIPVTTRYPAGTPFVAHYVRVNGTDIRYIDAGSGTPVIFLHGLGASIYSWRKNLVPIQSAGFRVIAFDNRGFGFSDKPAHGYSNADYEDLLIAFMDSLRLPDAVLVGHSMGGAIAAQCAATDPGRVRGLVLIDAAGFGVREPWVLRIFGWPVVGRLVSGLRSRWMIERILKSTYADPGKVRREDVDQYYAPQAEADFGRALRGVLHEFRFDALPGRLASVQIPTLVLWGERDEWIPVQLGRAIASELPRVAFLSVPNAGHALPEEAPGEVNRLVIAFLRDGIPAPPPDLANRAPGTYQNVLMQYISSTRRLRK
jgi:pimeloyl-ACP methyl ester carboxylesterase